MQLFSVLSSAKLQTFDFVMKKNKSFMKVLKRIGSMIEPCGTHVLISRHELKDEPIFRPLFPISKII